MNLWNKNDIDKKNSPDLPAVCIPTEVLMEIVRSIGSSVPEKGGILGGNREQQRITRFHFDHSATTDGAAYSPNTAIINETLDKWDAETGDKLIGFIHSHPAGYDRPSSADEEYAGRILKAIPALKRIFLPIAVFKRKWSDAYSEFVIHPFVADLDASGRVVICRVPLNLLDANGAITEQVTSWSTTVPSPFVQPLDPYADDTFKRVRTAYDLDLLRNSRLVVAGVGGSSEWVECMARAGVGQFVLIDHDSVALTNLATQQTYRRDLGRSKVDVLKQRILDINPVAQVHGYERRLEDLDDEAMQKILRGAIAESDDFPLQSLLCGFTDSFSAQTRINRLALHFGVSSLCAQVYKEGRGAEVTFTHPEITPACHRCALSGRYEAYANGTVETIGSEGSTIFATVRINALAGFIALAILHADGDHPRWGHLLQRIADRNLVLVRMDPEFGDVLDLDVFERTFGDANARVFFDETIWTRVTPDDGKNGSALCPDCGGIGLLKKLEGVFEDTLTGIRREGDPDLSLDIPESVAFERESGRLISVSA
jgi:proteasome lid subunit RPN8/RPN11